MIKRWADFPIIERGGPGKEWQFDGEQVVAFLQAKRDEEESAQAQKNELLAQLTLPIGRKDMSGRAISIDDEIKAAKLRALQRDELKEAGFLVPTLEVRTALERALRRFGQALDSAVDRAARKHNLPDAIKRSLESEFADARIGFVRDAAQFLPQPEQADDEQFALRA
jgi:phage terminase Nu1 subunit (DNA packaging protein)